MFTPQLLISALVIWILIFYVPALVHPRRFQKALKPILTDRTNTRLVGGMILLIALMFLSVEWRFSQDYLLVIPILGWLSLLKGIYFIWFPDHVKQLTKKLLLKSESNVTTFAVLAIVMAVILVYYMGNFLGGFELVAG